MQYITTLVYLIHRNPDLCRIEITYLSLDQGKEIEKLKFHDNQNH